jgi:hypothetical protein
MKVAKSKVLFLRGVLAMAAATRQVLDCEHVRRLCRLNKAQVGSALGQARKSLRADEPDFCAVVVNDSGEPGPGFGNTDDWARELRRVHDYWHNRIQVNNAGFVKKYGQTPSVP